MRPAAQGKGLGSRLTERLKDELGGTGVSPIYLVIHKGTPAEDFYKKNGYRVSDDDLIMVCE